MTTTEIAEEHGVSRQSIHTYRRTGVFPQPVEGQGSTRVRFREDEVAAFFAANPKQPGKKRGSPPQQQGDPVTTTTDPHVAALTEAVGEALRSLRGGYHHLAPLTETAVAEAVVKALAPLVAEQRTSLVAEVVEALTAKGAELSELAEEEMRPSLEERAQTWYEAAGVAEKLKKAKAASDG